MVSENAPSTLFSAVRALRHLEQIASQPHPIGSAEHVRVRDYILSALAGMGLQPQVQQTVQLKESDSSALAARVSNIVARLPGKDNSKAVLLCAHYDSVVTGPGAGDDGAGVATLLETLRAIQAVAPLKNDVILLFTDAEENGLLGAGAFIEQHPWSQDIGLVLNFEARGNSGPVWMFETSFPNGWLIQEFGRAVPHPVASSAAPEIYKYMPYDTDFSRFLEAGIPGLNFACIRNPSSYHTRLDAPENLDLETLQHHGSYALALAGHFGNLDLKRESGDGTAGSLVYFHLLGFKLFHYPESWVLPLLIVAVALFLTIMMVGLAKRRLTVGGIIGGFFKILLALLLVSLALTALWFALQLLDEAYAWMSMGHTYNDWLIFAGFASVTVAITLSLYRRFLNIVRAGNLAAGASLVWLGLAALSSVFAPGASYLFIWPLLFGLLSLGTSVVASSGLLHLFLLCLGAVPALVLFLPTVYTLYAGLGQPLSGMIMSSLALLIGLLAPQIAVVMRPWKWLLPGVATLAGILFLIAGTIWNGFNAEQPKPNSILYGLNADMGDAVWASTDHEVDEWTQQFFRNSYGSGRIWEFLPADPPRVLRGPAPLASLAAPVVSLVEDRTSGGTRSLRVRIKSSRGAPNLAVEVSPPNYVQSIDLDGQPLKRAGRWVLIYFNAPDQGFDLVLRTRAGRSIRVRAIDQSYGLPAFPDFSIRLRPPDMMPTPFQSRIQDCTFVSRSFSF